MGLDVGNLGRVGHLGRVVLVSGLILLFMAGGVGLIYNDVRLRLRLRRPETDPGIPPPATKGILVVAGLVAVGGVVLGLLWRRWLADDRLGHTRVVHFKVG